MNAHDQKTSPRSERWYVKPLMVIASVLAVLIVFEVTLEHFPPDALSEIKTQQPSKRSLVLREHAPGTERIVQVPETLRDTLNLGDTNVVMKTDANGFIEPTNRHSDPDVRIVFLGGSTTETKYVPAPARFPALSGRLLEEKTGLRVNTYNGGVGGNTSYHSMLSLLGKVVPMRPDAVVLMHAINDLNTIMIQGSYWPTSSHRGIVNVAASPPVFGGSFGDNLRTMLRSLKNLTFPNTYALAVTTGRALLGGEGAAEIDEFAPFRGRRVDVSHEAVLRDFRSSLAAFVETARAWRIEPVLLTQAHRIKVPLDPEIADSLSKLKQSYGLEPAEYAALYGAANQVIRDVAKEKDVILIDLEAEIPATKSNIYDIVHLNVAGSQSAAEVISNALAPIITERANSR